MMDVFSLEEDDASRLFITQEPRSTSQSESSGAYGVDRQGNVLPSVLQSGLFSAQYSDISDDDMGDFQCSQQPRTPLMAKKR